MIRRRLKALSKSFNWQSSLTIEGRRYVVPVFAGVRCEASEPWMTRLLSRLLDRPGAFVDVGANRGQTMLKVCALDPARQYVGFEPNPFCAWYLEKLIALNGLSNCTVYPVGIAAEAGFASLMLYDGEADSSASIVPAFRKRTGPTRNVALMAEASLPLPDQIAVVKIDVEGAELGVIEGLIATIRRARPVIVAEVLPAKDAARLDRQRRLEAILKGECYRIGMVDKETASVETIDTIGERRTMAEVDFVFSPM